MNKEETRQLLLLVMNVLTVKWNKIESQDQDQSMERWRNYKHIRNTVRDTINEIAKAKGIEDINNIIN